MHEPKKLLFHNKGEDRIRIDYLRFQSCVHPREWDARAPENLYLDSFEVYELPIRGPGEIFIKWEDSDSPKADHFTVPFDAVGQPYPYIFGGDKWTMALRHKALWGKPDGDAE